MTALIHSSLSSMGYVEGGADTVISSALRVLGRKGTLVLPTLCQKNMKHLFETWDIEKSPSDVGLVTETFRKWHGVLRSDHPTHSVAALGSKAEYIVSGHISAFGRPGPWGDRAFGHDSPWERMYLLNSEVVFLGVDFSVNTMGHLAQSIFVETLLQGAGEAGLRPETELPGWNRKGVWPGFKFEDMEAIFRKKALVRDSTIGLAMVHGIRSGPMVDAIIEELGQHPSNWLDEPFLSWMSRLTKQGVNVDTRL
jgi:aminoglycoside 3-N-acetyltransferase